MHLVSYPLPDYFSGQKIDVKREIYFSDLIARQKSSGLSVHGFCSNEGIAPSTFYYWQKKLRKAGSGHGFIPLVVKSGIPAPVERRDDFLLEVSYPNGITLRIRHDLDMDRLRALLSLMD